MRKILSYSLTALAAAMLVACMDGHDEPAPDGRTRLVLTGTIGRQGNTRAANGLMDAFSNTPVDVYMYTATERVGSWPLTYTVAADGTMTPPNGPVYLPDNIDEDGVSVYAIYPSGTTVNADGTVSLTVKSNQNADADYLASDLLFARTDAPKTDAVGNVISKTLTFNHMMAKILINVALQPEGHKLYDIGIANVYRTVSLTPSTYKFDYSLAELTSTQPVGEADLIWVYKSEDGIEGIQNQAALIAPQHFGEANQEKRFICMNTSAGIAWYAISGEVDFLPGCTYQLNLLVHTDAIGTVSVIHSWEIEKNEEKELNL